MPYRNSKVIVCVDDEKFVLDSLSMQIRRMFGGEYIVETAISGEEGLSLISELKAGSAQIPLVISDYLMPNMRGDVFLTKAGEIDPNIHKVMLTGQATMEGITSAVNNAGLYRYIAKPWEETDLRLTINEAVKSWSKSRELFDLLDKYELMYREAHSNYLEAKSNFVSSIRALANAIDARDPYTNGHSRRVTQYALLMGYGLRLPSERLEYLEYMATLHDIGKIGIPDAILYKESGLSEPEFDKMREHVRIGASIIEDMKSLRELIPGILYHHERYDGDGYIEGRSGEDIPLEARIISIADAYDAMTSSRPYRDRISGGEAARELLRCKGTQFDPSLVDIFVKALDSGSSILQ